MHCSYIYKSCTRCKDNGLYCYTDSVEFNLVTMNISLCHGTTNGFKSRNESPIFNRFVAYSPIYLYTVHSITVERPLLMDVV